MAENDTLTDGRNAERILADAGFQRAMTLIEDDYVAKWKVANNQGDREHLHACVKALADVRSKLEAMKVSKAIAESENRKFGRKS